MNKKLSFCHPKHQILYTKNKVACFLKGKPTTCGNSRRFAQVLSVPAFVFLLSLLRFSVTPIAALIFEFLCMPTTIRPMLLFLQGPLLNFQLRPLQVLRVACLVSVTLYSYFMVCFTKRFRHFLEVFFHSNDHVPSRIDL